MPEKQGIFNFEKQEAGRDIYNIAIQHLATGKKVYLPSIQYALRKGETTKGNFFKNEPEWIDFEQGFIVERKDVKEIADKLNIEKVQLVLGKPASGKSIILKNVGFKLTNDNKKIYIVELKKHQIEEVKLYFEAIPEINVDNPIFIVDDAHLYPSECEKLIRDFKSGGKGRLIIGSRPTEDILPNHPKKTSEFQFLNKTKIYAENATEGMIRTFLKRKHRESNFSDDRIITVSNNLQKYKYDLWQLSWALKAYNPKKDSVDEDEICEKIMLSITELETKDNKTINAEDVFLPLSVFYRFEIPIERYFLEEQLGIEGKLINHLIGLQEIEEAGKNKMLSLHHSSIAELYFGAYLRFPNLGRRIKKKILKGKDEEELEYCSFYQYITTIDTRNVVNIVNHLNMERYIGINMHPLLKKLIREKKLQKSIEKGLDREEDIGKIGLCVLYIKWTNNKIALKLVDSIDIDAMLAKIDKEKNISKVGLFIGSIKSVSEEVAMKLVDSVSAKINKEEDIEKIGVCIRRSENVSVDLFLMDYDSVTFVFLEEENELCCYPNRNQSKKVELKLVDSIDINALASKINKEKNILKVESCISAIALINKEVAKEIITRLNPKLRKELQKRHAILNFKPQASA